ncbi:DUF3977 family protein [Lactococcus lactis]
MYKYIEIGLGNHWLIRTEVEETDGSEWEVKGVSGEIKYVSFYLRVWVLKKVIIIDSKEGMKIQRKNRKSLKFIVGIKSKI